jgi:hypothetical protein
MAAGGEKLVTNREGEKQQMQQNVLLHNLFQLGLPVDSAVCAMLVIHKSMELVTDGVITRATRTTACLHPDKGIRRLYCHRFMQTCDAVVTRGRVYLLWMKPTQMLRAN